MYMSRKGVTPSTGDALDGMGVINFDNKTIVGTINMLDLSKPKGARLDNLSFEFDVSAGRLEDAALISQKAGTAGNFPTFQVLPVNGKNTYLIQFVDDDTPVLANLVDALTCMSTCLIEQATTQGTSS